MTLDDLQSLAQHFTGLGVHSASITPVPPTNGYTHVVHLTVITQDEVSQWADAVGAHAHRITWDGMQWSEARAQVGTFVVEVASAHVKASKEAA